MRASDLLAAFLGRHLLPALFSSALLLIALELLFIPGRLRRPAHRVWFLYAALLKALDLDPRDPQIPYALAIFYDQERQYERALVYAERLRELAPADPGSRQLLEEIKRQMAPSGAGTSR